MNLKEINLKLLMSNEGYKYISRGNIPINDTTSSFKEYIKIGNNKDIIDLFTYDADLCSYETEFYKFINIISVTIRTEIGKLKLFTINEDFKYFKDKFLLEYKDKLNEYIQLKKMGDKKRKDELEWQRLYDISTGIFDPCEADHRMFFNSITQPKSDDEIKCIRSLNFLIDQFYIYLYMKCEQAIYNLSNIYFEKIDRYLFDRFINLKNNFKLFNENDEKIMKELNDLWIGMKHQVEDKIDKSVYKEENIMMYLGFVEKIYNEIEKILKLECFVEKFNKFNGEIESVLNPLGLIGFE